MKIKKALFLFLFPLFCLSSCGEARYSGTYAFQLGKDSGLHFSFVMELTEDDYDFGEDASRKAKAFKAAVEIKTSGKQADSASISFDPSISESSLSSLDEPAAILEAEEPADSGEEESKSPLVGADSPLIDDSALQTIIMIAYSLLGDGKSIIGYYEVGEKEEGGERNLIHLGFVWKDDSVASLLRMIEDIAPEETFELDLDLLHLDYTVMEKIIYSTIDSKYIYLNIPVSIEDFVLQLFWYGYDVYFDVAEMKGGIVSLPEGCHHDSGTHPSLEEIEQVNAGEEFKKHHSDMKFRDYHALPFSLGKQ